MPEIQLPYYLSLPAADPPFPGVLVVHEGGGISAQLLRISERLAAEGYAVCAPDFFFRSGGPEAADFMELIGSITPEQLKGDLATGIGHLRDAGAYVDRRHRLLHGRLVHVPGGAVGKGPRRASGRAVLRRWDRPRDRRSRLSDAPLLRWDATSTSPPRTSRRFVSITATT